MSLFKILLADDEEVILKGISELVNWDKHGMCLVGTALDGEIAFDLIRKHAPDIVITDIKMPGMNGLELIRRTQAEFPHIRFIILSGHEEFEFAKQAMEHGVKHYLLKPCNEHKIVEVLGLVIDGIVKEREKEEFIRTTHYHFEKVAPQLKEQLLKEFLTNKTYGQHEWEYFRKLLGIDLSQEQVKLLLFEIEDAFDFEHVFALRNISTELVGASHPVLLETNIGERVALLVENCANDLLYPPLKRTRDVYGNYYDKQITIAVSDEGKIGDLRALYNQCMECLNHRFYVGKGALITHQDIQRDKVTNVDIQFDHDELILAVNSGNREQVTSYIRKFFATLQTHRVDIDLAKSYTLELFMVVVRQSGDIMFEESMKQVGKLAGMSTLDQLESFMIEKATELSQSTYEVYTNSRSRIVQKMMDYVKQYLDDESFSLNKLANDIMYMNADYIGKLFKKEVGQRFTNYLVQMRIKRAKELIREAEEVKVFEIAEKVGYGNNPQYFSQVFKKMTGYSPTGYKKRSS